MTSIRNRATHTSVNRDLARIHIFFLFYFAQFTYITLRILTYFYTLSLLITERSTFIWPVFEFLTRCQTHKTLFISWLTLWHSLL